nr:MAG TPA: hypothetical protein [Crassvirales sp.]
MTSNIQDIHNNHLLLCLFLLQCIHKNQKHLMLFPMNLLTCLVNQIDIQVSSVHENQLLLHHVLLKQHYK